MRDIDLYTQILGLSSPWKVDAADLERSARQLLVKVSLPEGTGLCCPQCGHSASGYDYRVRRWRHLDTCQYATILEARVGVGVSETGSSRVSVGRVHPKNGVTT